MGPGVRQTPPRGEARNVQGCYDPGAGNCMEEYIHKFYTLLAKTCKIINILILRLLVTRYTGSGQSVGYFRLCKTVLAPSDSSAQCRTVSLLCFITGVARVNNQTFIVMIEGASPELRDIFQFQILELNKDDPLNAEKIGI